LYTDSGCLARVNLDKFLADAPFVLDKFNIPTQIFPNAIAISSDRATGYVLNSGVNTLMSIDFKKAYNTANPPDYTHYAPTDIGNYRLAVEDAYSALFKHLLEFIKESFCDKFLVDCPVCTTDDKVYLGVVHIEAGQAFKICNLRKRKYVKTFRTVGYWLSTVPISPILKEALTQFCCKII
jgi:hypothetical protein